jgi:hypothetical protein
LTWAFTIWLCSETWPLTPEDRLLRIEKRVVEDDGAVQEVEPTHGAQDRDAIVAGQLEDQRIKELQAGQAHHQAAHGAG